MIISDKAWNNYIKKMRLLNNKAADLMQKYIAVYGTEDR